MKGKTALVEGRIKELEKLSLRGKTVFKETNALVEENNKALGIIFDFLGALRECKAGTCQQSTTSKGQARCRWSLDGSALLAGLYIGRLSKGEGSD